MGEEQRQALARLFAEDEEFKAAMMGATSVEDAVRIAGEHGIAATVEDFAPPEGVDVSDAELEQAAGGWATYFMPTMYGMVGCLR